MKMGNNVITCYWDEKGKPDGIRSTLCRDLFRRGIIHRIDGWAIKNAQNQIRGAFFHVKGPKALVDFLSWLTNLSVCKTNKVDVQTDNKTGQIYQIKEL